MTAFYTRLYVASDVPLSDLRLAVARAFDANIEMFTVSTDAASIDFYASDDSDPPSVERDPGNFLRYPYCIEIDASPTVTLERYLEIVASTMRQLHALGANVVASCDWEDRLPGSGKLGAVFEAR